MLNIMKTALSALVALATFFPTYAFAQSRVITNNTLDGAGTTVMDSTNHAMKVVGIGQTAGTSVSGITGSPVFGQSISAQQSLTTAQQNWITMDLLGNTRVVPQAGVFGGATPKHIVAANSDNSTSLKGSAGTVYGVQLSGIGSAPAYLKFYNKATAPTCGSDAVVAQYMIPANSTAANGGGNNVAFPVGKNFSTGIGYCVVAGLPDSDDTSVAAATFVINIDWQ